MKKIVFALLFALATSMALQSCTEEEVAPNTENGGGVFESSTNRT